MLRRLRLQKLGPKHLKDELGRKRANVLETFYGSNKIVQVKSPNKQAARLLSGPPHPPKPV